MATHPPTHEPNLAGIETGVEPRPWTGAFSAHVIGLFLWIAYFDRLGRSSLGLGGVAPAALGILLAAVLGYWLFYRPAAFLGFRSRQSWPEALAQPFGRAGVRFVVAPLIAAIQVLWFVVASAYALQLCFDALEILGFRQAAPLAAMAPAASGRAAGLSALVALVWLMAFAMVGSWFTRPVAAIMLVFPVFSAAVLAGLLLSNLEGLSSFRIIGIDPVTGAANPFGSWQALALTFRHTLEFLGVAGLFCVTWGAALEGERDVRRGGAIAFATSPVILGVVALLIVAGWNGRLMEMRPIDPRLEPLARLEMLTQERFEPRVVEAVEEQVRDQHASTWTIRSVLLERWNPWASGMSLFVFSLTSMAAAVYAIHIAGQALVLALPGLGRAAWTFLAAGAALTFLLAGWGSSPELCFHWAGALAGPIAGALLADTLRLRGRWLSPRPSANPAALFGVAAGLLTAALALLRADSLPAELTAIPPIALGFTVSLLISGLASAVGLGRHSQPDASSTAAAP